MSITVLVVDDSPTIREILSRVLGAEGDIKVVGTAAEPGEAREKIRLLDPDVLTLDIEMPNMNGLAFLDRLMRLRPMPVVMVSTLTQRGASETLLALELGAVDFAAKPSVDLNGSADGFGRMLRDKVRAAALANVRREPAKAAGTVGEIRAPDGAIVAIGASTGGVEAIRQVLGSLGPSCPPVVIAQHMPGGFTTRFAARLNDVTPLEVSEATDRVVLRPGHAYVARGGFHLRVERSGGGLVGRIGDGEPYSGHRPSVDVLFESVSRSVGPLAVGVILTGMGRDGATGLRAMREAGAHTIGQSPSSALVYGMPRVAFEEGGVVEQASVESVAARVAQALGRLRAAA